MDTKTVPSGFVTGSCKARSRERTALRRHVEDTTMPAQQFAVAHWVVEGVTTPYRHFRVQSCGVDSNDYQYLMCGGIEL